LPLGSKPSLQTVQLPLVASQLVHPALQFWQVPLPPVEKVPVTQAMQSTLLSSWKPALQVWQSPLTALQRRQASLQLTQASIPAEKVWLGQTRQSMLLGEKPPSQTVQTPEVLMQLLQLALQGRQEELPPTE